MLYLKTKGTVHVVMSHVLHLHDIHLTDALSESNLQHVSTPAPQEQDNWEHVHCYSRSAFYNTDSGSYGNNKAKDT